MIYRISKFALLFLLACGMLHGLSAQESADIAGIWEGKKVDGRFNSTEPWGPFKIFRNDDGTLSATFLGSRLGNRDLKMYEVTLKDGRFSLQMNRWGGAELNASYSPEEGIVGTLRHHGMVEDLVLHKIPDRSIEDILKLHKSGQLSEKPPYQSEFIAVLIEKGPELATEIFLQIRRSKPDYQLFGASVINSLGYKYLGEEKYADAITIFLLNTIAYPDDANSFDSLGEGYFQNGEREKAIAAFRKSLSMNPPPRVKANSIRLLKELGVDYLNERKI